MNPHFERNADRVFDRFVVPKKAYERIERIEPEVSSGPWTISFDAISADWLNQQAQSRNDFFNLSDLHILRNRWRDYWTQVAKVQGNQGAIQSPFEQAPLYRVEVPFQDAVALNAFGNGWLNRHIDDLEHLWFALEFHPDGNTTGALKCDLYYNAFTAPIAVFATSHLLDSASLLAVGLSTLATLDDFPEIQTKDFADELKSARGAEFLAVYDVGQGNSNALLSPGNAPHDSSPSLYFDVGCGVYANRGTTPSPLRFCFSLAPLIVMSHWDSDHWMGVCLPGMPNQVAGFGLNWVAPKQTITMHHKAFALDIIANDGSIRIYNPPAKTIGTANLPPYHQIRFTRGTRAGRNHSGIVLSVEKDIDDTWHSWLLTGDCDYKYFDHLMVNCAVAVVVPHHGAKPVTTTAAPTAASVYSYPYYVRAVYSFGPNNTQAGVRHPTSDAVAHHIASSWDEGGIWSVNPGQAIPAAYTLATCEHGLPNSRGGCIVGWTGAPAVTPVTCGCGCGSNTVLSLILPPYNRTQPVA